MTVRSVSPYRSLHRNAAGGEVDYASMVVIVNNDKKADSAEGLSRNNLYCEYSKILKILAKINVINNLPSFLTSISLDFISRYRYSLVLFI